MLVVMAKRVFNGRTTYPSGSQIFYVNERSIDSWKIQNWINQIIAHLKL